MNAVLSKAPPGREKSGGIACSHCGAPASGALTTERAGESLAFCCAGCRFVFGLIQSQGLGKFYDLREGPQTPAPAAVFERQNFDWFPPACEAAGGRLSIEVQGLSCLACVWLIKRVFEQFEGAQELRVDLLRGTADLQVAPEEFPCVKFAEALQRLGYKPGPQGASGRPDRSRRLVLRMGVCGALAMNAMLFSIPAYCGLETSDRLSALFARGALVCATGSMLTGASFFITRAWQAVRLGVVPMDLPISLGLLAAYAGSLHAWWSNNGSALYFDFVSIFTFLMLVGRWIHQSAFDSNRHRLLQTPATFLQPAVAERYAIQPGMAVPVRSTLLSPEATLGMEWINGESKPRRARLGEPVPSGAIHLGERPIELEAVENWEASLLAKLVALPPPKEAIETSSQRFILFYLLVVMLIAAGGFAGWFWTGHGLTRALQIAVSVLVVSCPCASGVALPMVAEFATARMRGKGVFVREASLWQRLLQTRHIVFDKTGTLTTECLQLSSTHFLEHLPTEALAALSTLVSRSLHPVATSLREALERPAGSVTTAVSPCEITGMGLEWQPDLNQLWRLGRASWALNDTPIEGDSERTILSWNGSKVAAFEFEETLRSDARSEVDALHSAGYEISILSGDHPARVEHIASNLGLPSHSALGGLTPEDKAAWLHKHHARTHTLMLGDGANDSLAFAESLSCGTPAVDRGVLEQRADFYYLGRGLSGVRSLLEEATHKRTVARGVLCFTTVYNVAAISMALLGKMNPMVAAVIMPLSSLATLWIVVFCYKSTRLTPKT